MENIRKINVGGVDYGIRTDLDDRMGMIEDKVFPLVLSVLGGGTFEKGTSQTVTVSWTLKKGDSPVTAESVTVNGEAASGTSKQFAGVQKTTEYTVEAAYQGKTVQGSTTATFVAPMYFGFAAASEVSELDVTSLGKQALKTAPNGSYTLENSTTGHYLWLCVPTQMNVAGVTSSGFDVPMEDPKTKATSVDFYKCYRSTSPINAGGMSIVIS